MKSQHHGRRGLSTTHRPRERKRSPRSRKRASPAETEARRDIALARPLKGRPMTRIVIVGNDTRTGDLLAGRQVAIPGDRRPARVNCG